MATGLSINIFIGLIICIVSLVFAYSLYRRYSECNKNNSPTQISMMVIWGMIGLYFVVDIFQQLITISGNVSMQFPLYILSLVPFTLTSLPIVFFIVYILSGNKYIGAGVSSLFLVMSLIYIYIIISTEQINIISTSWGLLVLSNNNIANIIYLLGLFIVPTSMILGLLILFLLKQIPKFRKYKICLSLFSISIVYDFLLLNSFSQTGEMMIAAKIFIFLGIVLGYFANFPPKIVESKYFPKIPAIE